jgi:hypothetical protein
MSKEPIIEFKAQPAKPIEIMKLTSEGVWVDPSIHVNDAAKMVIAALDKHIKHVVNSKLEEVAAKAEQDFKAAFGTDTCASWACWIRQQKHKLDLTTYQELDYKTLYEQMCERYDTLDKKMGEIEPVYNQLLMTQLPGFEDMTITPNQPSELMRDAGNKALDRIKTEPDMVLADRAYYVYIDMLAQARKEFVDKKVSRNNHD